MTQRQSARDYKVGDVIEYRAFGNELRQVRVTSKDDDVRDGAPGFDGILTDDRGFAVWGYDDQIVRIVSRA